MSVTREEVRREATKLIADRLWDFDFLALIKGEEYDDWSEDEQRELHNTILDAIIRVDWEASE